MGKILVVLLLFVFMLINGCSGVIQKESEISVNPKSDGNVSNGIDGGMYTDLGFDSGGSDLTAEQQNQANDSINKTDTGKPVKPIVGEWSQHGHDAQRTGYTTHVVEPPWQWKWAWNGPIEDGGVSNGKTKLPRNVQPITGGGRVYIAAGERGVYALSEENGAEIWNSNLDSNAESTPAYDPESDCIYVASSGGEL